MIDKARESSVRDHLRRVIDDKDIEYHLDKIIEVFKSPDNPEGYELETTDESRLLTDNQPLLDVITYYGVPYTTQGLECVPKLLKDQRDLTASIKNAKCDARFRNAATRQLKKIDKLWDSYVEKLSEKDTECQERVEEIRQEIIRIDCMEDIADARKAITSLVYSLKKQEIGLTCPKCKTKLDRCSGVEKMPNCWSCPVCKDIAYDEDGQKIGKLE